MNHQSNIKKFTDSKNQNIISKKAVDTIPTDFDWQYYLKNYPDLSKAGISTELGARHHYIKYGKKEGRIFCLKNEPCKNENESIKKNYG